MAAKKNTGFLIAFGLVFLSVGLGMGLSSVRMLWRAQAMLAWCEVPAQVLACDLKVESDSESTTYRVEAEYAYAVDGVRYTGTRVSLRSGSDNIGDYHQRMHAALSACMRKNAPTTCWVNPHDPGDAVLDRRIRPEMVALDHLFCLAFGGFGLAAVLVSASGWLRRRAEIREEGGAIRMRSEATCWIVGAVACVWNAYAAWLLATLWQVIKPEPVPWYLWSLAVVGAILLVTTVRLCWRFCAFGVSTLSLSSPAAVGGPLTGTIRIPAKVAAVEGFDLRLRCHRRYTMDSGGESSTTTECCWEASSEAVNGFDYGDETRVPVKFAIPCDQRATTEEEASDRYTWRLTVTAKTRGIGYRAAFDVPVSKGLGGSQGRCVPADEAMALAENIEDVVGRLGWRFERLQDCGFELVCPAAQAKGMIAMTLVITLVWSGICFALWCVPHLPRPMLVIFGLFECLLVWSLADALFVASGVRVERGRRECVVWRRFLGMTCRAKRVPFEEVRDFRGQQAAQSASCMYFQIVLFREPRGSLRVMTNVKTWNDAKQIAAFLTKAVKQENRR